MCRSRARQQNDALGLQVGILVAYMLDASRQREVALFAVWATLTLANTTNAIASFGRHGGIVQHVAVFMATTGARGAPHSCVCSSRRAVALTRRRACSAALSRGVLGVAAVPLRGGAAPPPRARR